MFTKDTFRNGWNMFIVRTLVDDVWVTKAHHTVSDLERDLMNIMNIRKYFAYSDMVLSDEKIYVFAEDDAEPLVAHVVLAETENGCSKYDLCIGAEVLDTFYL
ncbi:MAG TPA: hypothetical protein VLT90_12980 [Terriglobales bacterium]|nr:hypothetical protein [Terriglobales bacterium]